MKRARFCLHRNDDDAVHEMIIVLHKDSYIRPHKHVSKTESFHIIEGELLLVFFDDSGKVIRRIIMGQKEGGKTFAYRLSAELWHTVIPLSEFVVFHETTNGPFIREDCIFASWEPDFDDQDSIKSFIRRIKQG